MEFTIQPQGLIEQVALWLNLGPTPVAQAFFGMMGARAAMAGLRLGVYAELARAPATPAELAERLKLHTTGTERLLETLDSLDLVRRRGGAYVLRSRARRWLDPASPHYVGGFLDFNYTQWEWWSQLEDVIRTGKSAEIHRYAPDDPRWRLYITAMFELARLAGPEVARAVPLRPGAQRLLDLAGAHGWFAAELCHRHPGLSATVLDLPGSVRVGRELIAKAGMGERVMHVEGDLFRDDLGGPFDGVLCFQIVHHLTPDQNIALLGRVARALAPGGTVAILEYFLPESNQRADAAAMLGLHYYLTSGAAAYRLEDVEEWLTATGFEAPRARAIRRIPFQTLVVARRR